MKNSIMEVVHDATSNAQKEISPDEILETKKVLKKMILNLNNLS